MLLVGQHGFAARSAALWKQALAKQYAAMEAASASPEMKGAIADMVMRGTRVGRDRALAKIGRLVGGGCALEQAQLDGKRPYAVFSVLKPREGVVISEGGEPVEAALAQDCVAVHYLAVGCMSGVIGSAEGLWSIEVPDHALGRAVARSGFLHPGAIIREAHASLLSLPANVVEQSAFDSKDGRGALVKAGPGAFVAQIWAASDVSLGGAIGVHVRARTWLADDMLHEDQTLLEPRDGEARLGDVWLRPVPFRRIVREGDRLMSYGWEP
jgi:hypothetical protein